MIRLAQLIDALGGTCEHRDVQRVISDVFLDHRRVRPGALFAALPGTRIDGVRFAADAVGLGASAVLSPQRIDEPAFHEADCPNWVHPEARRVAGEAAARVYDLPARGMAVVGITGTNGKSTVAHLTGQLLEHVGRKPAVIGTVGFRLWGGEVREATHTTPDAAELQRLCLANREQGGDAFVLEASSHALDQERLAGLELNVAVFTNLSREHLDYHGDMDAYAAAKERIFEYLVDDGVAVVNADDEHAERMQRAAARRGVRVVTYGIGSRADLRASGLDVGTLGTHLILEGMGVPWTGLFLPLVGQHNVENALAAAAAVLSLGASPSRTLEGLATVSSPPGRLQPVEVGERGFHAFVDYAHTPDALERVLRTLRDLPASPDEGARRRILCVFGCGGERDELKRAPMGRIVGELADVAIVTSDNPRGEDPDAIIAQVVSGMDSARAEVVVEPDRRRAIRHAVGAARKDDIVLVAGKGHEVWQRLSGRKIPFDDRRVVAEELR